MNKLFFILFIIAGLVFASSDHEDHDHAEVEHEKTEEGHEHGEESHDDHGDHGDEEGHEHGEESHGDHDDHGDEEGHEHGSSKAVGEGKAITAVDEEKGFSMSQAALDFMGVQFKNAISSSFQVPASALVVNRNAAGFYRLRKGFFKFVPLKAVSRNGENIDVSDPEWQFGDRIVVLKVDLIRVSDIYSTDESEYGHAH